MVRAALQLGSLATKMMPVSLISKWSTPPKGGMGHSIPVLANAFVNLEGPNSHLEGFAGIVQFLQLDIGDRSLYCGGDIRSACISETIKETGMGTYDFRVSLPSPMTMSVEPSSLDFKKRNSYL